MSLDGGQFTFLGQSVTLTERYQIVKLHGPWMAEKGRHSFRRGFVKLPDGITEHDETAAHMLMRIEKSAAPVAAGSPLVLVLSPGLVGLPWTWPHVPGRFSGGQPPSAAEDR